MTTYDHIILGSGQAAGTLLGKLIPTGDAIAVIEAAKVGGSCVNYGCTPTKALVASAKAIHRARQGEQFGFAAGEVRVDYAAVRERMNRIRGNSRSGLVRWMEKTGNVDLIRGHGTFTGPTTLRVGDREISGKHIYINTGTRPRVPAIAGLDQVPWLDSAGLLNQEALPQHLLIVGGGYIGVEFAQVFRRFGAEVTILQRSGQLMPKEDKDVANAIRDFLQAEGIRVLCSAAAQSVVARDGGIELTVDLPGEQQIITGSDLLIAAGRIPNSDRIGLDAAGIATREGGYIEVDDHCQTNVENVFAVGDVNGHGAFTHTSVNDAEIVLDHRFGGPRKLSDRIPVYALFSDPPLGRVGLSEKEALAQGKKVLVATKPMAEISRAKEMGETTGFAKLLVDGETDLILGAAILGPGGDEIINMFAAIMHSQIPCHNYRQVVLVHPTVSELMPWMLDGIEEARTAEE
jgi:pyruvate/2-oxoglutarate dehydrogenase complex dihydrolipoamide dehydrogenase (E3) component